jgi:hypothetical protein
LNSLFCRHNRFTADCPICSKGTVLDPARDAAKPRQRAPSSGTRAGSPRRSRAAAGGAAREYRGPFASAGPYERDDGTTYEVRLERVPGGLRLAVWVGGAIQREAPVLAPADLVAAVAEARERDLIPARELEPLERALATAPAPDSPGGGEHGVSAGSAGDLREELRVEVDEQGMLRVGRWIFRAGTGVGWELQETPVMLPAKRFAQAIADAARKGVLPAASPSPQQPSE